MLGLAMGLDAICIVMVYNILWVELARRSLLVDMHESDELI